MRTRLALSALFVASGLAARAADLPPPAPPPVVVVTHAQPPTGNGDNLLLPGTIEAWQATEIHARTSGYVKHWYADIGDHVTSGQLLAEIEAPEVDQLLAASRAVVAQAEANLEIARLNFDRWKKLVAKKTVSEFELDERAALFKARSADLLAARANRQRYEELARFKRVLAPFAGTVTRRNVENGVLIDAGSGTNLHEMYRVAETSRLRIRVGVPQSRMREITVGMPADVLVSEFPGKRFGGKIVRTAGAIEPASRTLLTEVELDNANGDLLPGLYAQVAFKLAVNTAVVLVPTNTVRFDGTGARVATVDGAGTVRVAKVDLGRNLGTQFEVVHGLAAATPVILNPTDLLVDGLKVEVKEAPAAKP